MIKIASRICLAALLLFVVVVPVVVDGQNQGGSGIENPIGKTTVEGIIVAIVKWLAGLAGALAILALVWGGIMYIVSLGDDSRVNKAKSIIMWAIVGIAVVILSYVMLNIVSKLLTT